LAGDGIKTQTAEIIFTTTKEGTGMNVLTLRPALAVAMSFGLLGWLLAGTAQADPPGPLTVPPPPAPADEFTIPPLPAFGPIDQHSQQMLNGTDFYIGRFRLHARPASPMQADRLDATETDFLVPPVYPVVGKAKLTDQKSCFPADCCSKSATAVKTVSNDGPCCPLSASPPQPAAVKLRLGALPCCSLGNGIGARPDRDHPAAACIDGLPLPVGLPPSHVEWHTPADSERQRLLNALMTMTAENAKLKAQAEFADRQERMFQTILDAREENAKLKGQLERMVGQQEAMQAILESREEIAKLKAQIELLGQQQEFFTGMVEMQFEAEKTKLENAQLKARLSELDRPSRPTVTVLPAPEAATVKPNKGQRLRIQAIVPTDYVPVPTPADDCDEAEEVQPN
jgi:hypothetical protein